MSLPLPAANKDSPKGDYKGWTYYTPKKYPDCGCFTPSVYEFVSNSPNLTIAKTIIDALGLQAKLSGPFTGTLLLPTDAVSAAAGGATVLVACSLHA